MPKWVFPLLLLFVIFFVLSSPETAGPQARDFFGWIGDQAAAAGTFLDGLFGDGTSPTSSEPATTPTTPGQVDPSGVTASNDQFTS